MGLRQVGDERRGAAGVSDEVGARNVLGEVKRSSITLRRLYVCAPDNSLGTEHRFDVMVKKENVYVEFIPVLTPAVPVALTTGPRSRNGTPEAPSGHVAIFCLLT